MSFRKSLAAAATALIAGCSTASAATVYDAFSHTISGVAEHSLWFSGSESSNPPGATGAKSNHFLFENSVAGKGTFTVDGVLASLTGIVQNAGGQAFSILLNLVETSNPGAGHQKGTGLGDADSWTYYTLDSSKSNTLTSLSGLASYDITLDDAMYDAQFGIGANDKNAGLLGFSSWVILTETGACTSYSNCSSRTGDLNLLLAGGGGGSGTVPLPASIVLLPAALGMFGAVGIRRRRKS